MNSSYWILDLRSHLPEDAWCWVLLAIKKDPLVWQALGNPRVYRQMAAIYPGNPEFWTPAQIGLVSLKERINSADLRSDPEYTLPSHLTPILEKLVQSNFQDELTIDLGLACQVALSAWDRQRKGETWDSILASVVQHSEISRTALACLIGMVPQPIDILALLIQMSNGFVNIPEVVHALLANPTHPESQFKLFLNLIEQIPWAYARPLVGEIARHRPVLASMLRSEMEKECSHRGFPPSQATFKEFEKEIASFEFNQFFRKEQDGTSTLEKVLDLSNRLTGEIAYQLACTTQECEKAPGNAKIAKESLKKALRSDPTNPVYLAKIIDLLITQARYAEVTEWIESFRGNLEDPAIHYQLAHLNYLQGNTSEAIDYAINSLNLSSSRGHQDDGLVEKLGTLFIKLHLPECAIMTAKIDIDERPLNPHLLTSLSLAHMKTGLVSEALEEASVANAVFRLENDQETNPVFSQIPGLFIEALESAGEWRLALDERLKISAGQKQETAENLNGIAFTALMAGEPGIAQEFSAKAIEIDPENADSHENMGKACLELGKLDGAIKSAQAAIRLCAVRETSWLTIAHAYQLMNQPDKVLDTLRAAAQAIPDSLWIQLELGEHCATHHAPTQAIDPLQKANRILKTGVNDQPAAKGIHSKGTPPEDISARIALNLGKALRSVGKDEESHKILEEGIQSLTDRIDQYPELLFAYAKSLQDKGDTEQAIPVFECVLQIEPDNLPVCLDLCQALVDVSDQPSASQQAVPLLKSILSDSSDESISSRARVLLAEALFQVGELEGSKKSYLQSLNTPISKAISWQGRISFGLGKVNQRLDQPEAAIAAFLEAEKATPHNAEIYRSLTETYLSLNLLNEARNSAKEFIQHRVSDDSAIIWFASMAAKIQSLSNERDAIISEAIHQLLKLIQKNPKIPRYWLELGKLQVIEKDVSAATAAFDQLVELDCCEDKDYLLKSLSLYEAGSLFLKIKEYEKSAFYLEQASKPVLQRKSTSDPLDEEVPTVSAIQILSKASEAYRLSGQYEAATDLLRQVIDLDPDLPDSYSTLGELLFEMDQTGDAIGCFEKAIELSEKDRKFDRKLIWVYTVSGELSNALETAEKGIHLAERERQVKGQDNQVEELQLRYLAAEIARSLLQFDRAQDYLAINLESTIDTIADDLSLFAQELQLENPGAKLKDEDIEPRKISTVLPRSLALEARKNPGNLTETELNSLTSLIESYSALVEPAESRFDALSFWKNRSILRSLAEFSLVMENWEASQRLFQKVVEFSPFEPFAFVRQARAYCIRAEKQNFSAELELVCQAPGKTAVDISTFQEFSRSIEKAFRRLIDANHGNLLSTSPETGDPGPHEHINYWQARGGLAFKPETQAIDDFARRRNLGTEDIQSILLAKRMIREDSESARIVQSLPSSLQPSIFQVMVLEYTRPWEALEITCQVIDNWQVYASSKGPEYADWYFLLARLTNHTGGQNRLGISAVDAIERALASHPNEPRWHSIAAEYLSHRTNEGTEAAFRDRAKIHLETAIQFEPDFAYHYYAMAKILRDEAENGSAINTLNKASELAPLSADIRLFLAKIQFENGDLENAATNADIAIENSAEPIEALLLRGEISLMIGDPKDAQTKAQSILDLDPGHLEALQLYARSLNALDQPEEALEIMAKVIPQVEKPLPLELERAQWFCETEPSTESVIELRNLIQRYPQEPLFKAYLAEILDRQHQGESAILVSRQALQNSDLGLPVEKQAQLHLIIGKNSHESGQLDHAIHHLSQALDLNPANLEAYFELGRTYQTRRNYQEAAKTYQNAIHIAPKDYRPYYFAGLALKEAKEYQSSEAMLRRAIELSPGEKTIRKQLGAVIALNFVHNGRSAIFPTQSK